MRKKYTLIIFIALISFLMLACSMIYDTTINEDGSGIFSINLYFTEEEVNLFEPVIADLGGEIQSPQEICDSISTELVVGYQAETDFIVEDTNYTCIISYEFKDLTELENLYEEIDAVVYDLQFTDDGYLVYDIEFSVGDEVETGFEEYDIDLTIEYLWQVTSPFNIVEHNADNIYDKTVSVEFNQIGSASLYFMAGSSGATKLYSDSTLKFLTEIAEDESGIMYMNFMFDADQEEKLLEMLDELDIGDEAEDWCDEIEYELDELSEIPSGMDNEFEQEEAGEGFVCQNYFEFDDLDELEEIYEGFEFIDPDILKIRDGVLEYEVVVDLAKARALGLDKLEANMDLLWAVSSPWPVNEHDATIEDGKTLSWEMKDGEELEVVFTAEKTNFLLYLIIGGALVLLVLIVVIVVLIKSKKKKAQTE
jgi:hypothetical protein